MKNTKLKWRLSDKLSVAAVTDLLSAGVINKEEAKEILFNLETEEDRDKASLEAEIEFLRALVEKLSSKRTQIIESIKYIEKPYQSQPWIGPYITWCASTNDAGDAIYKFDATGAGASAMTVSNASFSKIKTF